MKVAFKPNIVDDLMNNTINRKEADARLKKLPLDEYENKFAKALGGLPLKLMFILIDENANVTELCSRFIDPFSTSLFDNPDEGICLCRDIFRSHSKSARFVHHHYCGSKNLLNICISCKDALEHQPMKQKLVVQISYLLILPDKGLYSMTEITTIEILDSFGNPLSLILQFSNLWMYLIELVYSTRMLRVKKPCHPKIRPN
ncbi:hypothetical protein A0J61_06936 [Choanephora cucurbitarum]|uniref:Uncharacterized protein n=1 Tax=Choanephora cucurbitarum TaxID=101091 RepID=A0A1C7N7A6_9FUNG|nr:hypothetical protein A0J61_06936 [Choanephora cucurbitarum]